MIANEQAIVERAKSLYYKTENMSGKECLRQAVNELGNQREIVSLFNIFDITLQDIVNSLYVEYFVGDNYSEN